LFCDLGFEFVYGLLVVIVGVFCLACCLLWLVLCWYFSCVCFGCLDLIVLRYDVAFDRLFIVLILFVVLLANLWFLIVGFYLL